MFRHPDNCTRGCGTRKKYGTYAECGTVGAGEGGMPVEYFMHCPPTPVEAYDIPIRGVAVIEVDGVYHIFRRVGIGSYPNVPDILEEGRRHGFSIMLPPNLDFSKISGNSRIILVHDRAIIQNYQDLTGEPSCPKEREEHHLQAQTETFCSGYWYHNLEGTEPVEGDMVRRDLASGDSYFGKATPPDFVPEYQMGTIITLPVTRLIVVDGDDKDKVAKRKQKIDANDGIETAITTY